MKWLGVLILLIISNGAIALKPVLFGPEFTFCNEDKHPGLADYLAHLKSHLVQNQPEGEKFTNYFNKFFSPNGWWFDSAIDSQCIEVTMKPMTAQQYKFYKDDIQDAIFASAAATGYFPALWQGGGHINIDVTNFKRNLLLFRNFIVDLLNHNELAMGIFDYNMNCCSFPHELSRSDIPLAFKIIDEKFEDGSIQFEDIVASFTQNLGGRAFSFWNIQAGRFEIRAVRPQASMDVWTRQISLLEGRMKYLETIKERIPYKPRVPWNYSYLDMNTPPIPPQEALKSFYVYVTESGQRWQDHTDYVWPMWVSGGEVQKFEQSEWFLNQEHAHHCAQNLGVGA